MSTLKSKVASGAALAGSAQVIRVVTQFFIVLPILTRLLTPEDYGIIAMGLALVVFFMIFNNFGIGPALVRHENPTESLWATAFWTNMGVGVTLALLAYFGAGLVAALYMEPRVEPVVEALAVVLVLHCAVITPTSLMQRNLQFGPLAGVQLAAQLGGSAVAIAAALMGAGVWALVFEQLAHHVIKTGSTWWFARPPIRLTFNWPELKRVLPFSLNLLATDFTGYVARNADNFIIGRYLGASALGFYSRAYQIMLVPLQVLVRGAGSTLFPALSSIQDDKARLGAAYLRGVQAIALIAFPMMLGVAALSGPFVRFAFGETWAETAPILSILAPVGALQCVTATRGSILMAVGRADILFYWALLANSVAVVSFMIGVNWGVEGVATAFLIASAVMFTPAMAIALWKVDLGVVDLYRRLGPIMVASLVMAACVWAASRALDMQNAPDYVQLLACIPLGGAVYGALIYWLDRAASQEMMRLGMGLLRRGRQTPAG